MLNVNLEGALQLDLAATLGGGGVEPPAIVLPPVGITYPNQGVFTGQSAIQSGPEWHYASAGNAFKASFDLTVNEIQLTKPFNSGAAFSTVTVSDSGWLPFADHTNPAVWINPTDGAMHVVVTRHNENTFEMRKSTDGTFTAFGAAIDLTTEFTDVDEFTYNLILQHTQENANDVKVITRGRSISLNSRGIYMIESTDGGDTWGASRRILNSEDFGERPYFLPVRNQNPDRAKSYIPFSDTNPEDAGPNKSMRVAILENGVMKDIDGTVQGDEVDPNLYTAIYTPPAGWGTRPMYACMDQDGKLVIAFVSRNNAQSSPGTAAELYYAIQDSVDGATFTVEKVRDLDVSTEAAVLWGVSAVDYNDSRFVYCVKQSPDGAYNVARFFRSSPGVWEDQGYIWAGYPGMTIPRLNMIEIGDAEPRMDIGPRMNRVSGNSDELGNIFRLDQTGYLHNAGGVPMNDTQRQAKAIPNSMTLAASLTNPPYLHDFTNDITFFDALTQSNTQVGGDVRRIVPVGATFAGHAFGVSDLTMPVRRADGVDFSTAVTSGLAIEELSVLGPDWFFSGYVTVNSSSGVIFAADTASGTRILQVQLPSGSISAIGFGGGTPYFANDPSPTPIGTPTLVTAYCIGGSLVLRVNGTQVGNATIPNPNARSDFRAVIGNRIHNPASDDAFDGTIHRMAFRVDGDLSDYIANVADIESQVGAAL